MHPENSTDVFEKLPVELMPAEVGGTGKSHVELSGTNLLVYRTKSPVVAVIFIFDCDFSQTKCTSCWCLLAIGFCLWTRCRRALDVPITPIISTNAVAQNNSRHDFDCYTSDTICVINYTQTPIDNNY